jgi:hypothetical protein
MVPKERQAPPQHKEVRVPKTNKSKNALHMCRFTGVVVSSGIYLHTCAYVPYTHPQRHTHTHTWRKNKRKKEVWTYLAISAFVFCFTAVGKRLESLSLTSRRCSECQGVPHINCIAAAAGLEEEERKRGALTSCMPRRAWQRARQRLLSPPLSSKSFPPPHMYMQRERRKSKTVSCSGAPLS